MRVTGLTRWLDQAGDLPPNVGPSVQGGSGPVTTELSSGGGLPMRFNGQRSSDARGQPVSFGAWPFSVVLNLFFVSCPAQSLFVT